MTPRFRVTPGDVPAEVAARRMGLTLAVFESLLPRLVERGFPPADPVTGHFDLEAIDRWRHLRHPRLFPELTAAPAAIHSGATFEKRRQAAFGQG